MIYLITQVEALNELCNYGGGVMKETDLAITEVRGGKVKGIITFTIVHQNKIACLLFAP